MTCRNYALLTANSLDEAWKFTMENVTQLDTSFGNHYKLIAERYHLPEGELPNFTTAAQWEQYLNEEDYSWIYIFPVDPIRISGDEDSKEWVLVGHVDADQISDLDLE